MIDINLLKNFDRCLSDIVPDDDHFSIDQVRGLFYARMITPENALLGIKNDPSVWLSELFYGEKPALTEAQVNALNIAAGSVHDAYKAIFTANKLSFPYKFDQLDAEMAESAYAWCEGFFAGLSINELFWLGKSGGPLKNSDKELESVRNSTTLFIALVTKDFSEFDEAKLAELKTFVSSQGQEATTEVIAATLFPSVPTAVTTLQLYGMKQMRAVHKTANQPTRKIGRNELCYCGSGKKYKKCCGG